MQISFTAGLHDNDAINMSIKKLWLAQHFVQVSGPTILFCQMRSMSGRGFWCQDWSVYTRIMLICLAVYWAMTTHLLCISLIAAVKDLIFLQDTVWVSLRIRFKWQWITVVCENRKQTIRHTPQCPEVAVHWRLAFIETLVHLMFNSRSAKATRSSYTSYKL